MTEDEIKVQVIQDLDELLRRATAGLTREERLRGRRHTADDFFADWKSRQEGILKRLREEKTSEKSEGD